MQGVQVKLCDRLGTRAIHEHLKGEFTTRHYTNPHLPLPYLYLAYTHYIQSSLLQVMWFIITIIIIIIRNEYYCSTISQKTLRALNSEKYVSVMQSDITVKCTLKQQRFQSLLETSE